jgi:hypothetical protein
MRVHFVVSDYYRVHPTYFINLFTYPSFACPLAGTPLAVGIGVAFTRGARSAGLEDFPNGGSLMPIVGTGTANLSRSMEI